MKKLISKIFVELENISESITNSLENSYYQIFRGGIFLIGIGLIGLSQTMPELLNHEEKAMELRYEFEERSNIKLSKANCEDFKSLYKECSLAKYKAEVVSSAIEFLNNIVRILFFTGVAMLPFSAIGFVSKAVAQKPQETAQAETTPDAHASA